MKPIAVMAALASCLFCAAAQGIDDAEYRIKYAQAVRAAAERVLPSIVTIELIGAAGTPAGEVEQDAPTSGVVVSDEGFIIASDIVVRRPTASILVVLPDSTRHPAKVVSRDNHRDLVLLKVTTEKPLTPIELPDELDLKVGQSTIAVGRYGADVSPIVSSGVLSAIDRLDGIALQTDARVSPAFYGGPLINLTGQVVGILVPAVAPGGAPDATSWYDSGIAFAIPANIIKQKLDRLQDGQDIDKGLIGIVAKSQDPYENSTELGAVRVRSPAETAGLKAGDVVISVAERKVQRFQEIRQVLGSYDAGETIPIEYERDGKQAVVEVELAQTIPPLQPQKLGIAVREETLDAAADDANNEEEDEQFEVVVDAIVPVGAAFDKLQAGDVILKVAEAEINDTPSLRRQLISAEPDKPLKIVYRRGEEQSETSITPNSVAGPLMDDLPEDWKQTSKEAWKVKDLKLPEVENAAAYVAPQADDDSADRLGLLVLLLNPGQKTPSEVLATWPEIARTNSVVVCTIAPQNKERWQPKEIENVSRIVSAILKQVPIDQAAVAIAAGGVLKGGKAEAADSMALAVAVAESKTFFGVAVSHQSRPPAVRLRENDPSSGLQLLLPIADKDEYPAWASALEKAGYPIVMGGEVDGAKLLRWVRLLQTI